MGGDHLEIREGLRDVRRQMLAWIGRHGAVMEPVALDAMMEATQGVLNAWRQLLGLAAELNLAEWRTLQGVWGREKGD